MSGSFLITDCIQYMMPEIVLFFLGSIILLVGPFAKKNTPWALISSLGFLLAYFLLLSKKHDALDQSLLFSTNILEDTSSNFIRHFSLGMGLFFSLLFWRDSESENSFETMALIMFLVTGCSIVGISNDLIVLFLGLELISIPTYVLLYLHGKKDFAAESAMKYFFLSIFSSGLILLGFSYLYGIVGTTNISAISDALSNGYRFKPAVDIDNTSGLLFLIPMLAILAGLGFKISMVPFHFYAPDVYQGSSYRMCALLATVSKVAGFAAIIRIFGFALAQGALPGTSKTLDNIYVLFWILATVTMTIGTILGLLQRNLRRILAYSSISHSGYILAGIAVAPKLDLAAGVDGIGASFFYLIAYFFGTFGVFAVLDVLDTKEKPIEDWDDLAGVGTQNPLLAICLAVFLFSLIGIPFTGGFLAKFFIVFGCVSVPYSWDDALSKGTHNLFFLLGIIAFLNAAIGSWIYLRILSGVYFKPAIWPKVLNTSFRPSYLPIFACLLIVVVLGVKPNLVINLNLLKGMADQGNNVSLSKINISKPAGTDIVLKRQ
jgi:NADH-quinone oxidoreductase subunit N